MKNLTAVCVAFSGAYVAWLMLAPAVALGQDFGMGVFEQLTPKEYERGEVRDLKIGMHFSEILPDFYFEHACGSNGGPPLKSIGGFGDFLDCAAEPITGLHEVYVRYDDQNEFVVRLYRELEGEQLWLERFTGTKVGGHPVFLSVLFDDEGSIGGIRVITDSRAPLDQRRFAHLLGRQVLTRYGPRGWECTDLDPTPGQTDVGGLFIKQVCTKDFPGEKWLNVESHLFRKPGQDGLDDRGNYLPGDFESSTRFEIFAPDIPGD